MKKNWFLWGKKSNQENLKIILREIYQKLTNYFKKKFEIELCLCIYQSNGKFLVTYWWCGILVYRKSIVSLMETNQAGCISIAKNISQRLFVIHWFESKKKWINFIYVSQRLWIDYSYKNSSHDRSILFKID